MDILTRMLVKAREYQHGQTMAEYALIMAAVAVNGFRRLPNHGYDDHHAVGKR